LTFYRKVMFFVHFYIKPAVGIEDFSHNASLHQHTNSASFSYSAKIKDSDSYLGKIDFQEEDHRRVSLRRGADSIITTSEVLTPLQLSKNSKIADLQINYLKP